MFSFKELQTGTYLRISFEQLWMGIALFRFLIHCYSNILLQIHDTRMGIVTHKPSDYVQFQSDKTWLQVGWALLPNNFKIQNRFSLLG